MIEGERKNMPGHFSKKFFEYPSTEWADLVHFLLSVRFRSVGLQTPRTSRTKTNSKSAVFSIEEFGFDGAFRLAAIKARQTNKLSFDEQTINFELETAKQTIQQSHPNLYLD